MTVCGENRGVFALIRLVHALEAGLPRVRCPPIGLRKLAIRMIKRRAEGEYVETHFEPFATLFQDHGRRPCSALGVGVRDKDDKNEMTGAIRIRLGVSADRGTFDPRNESPRV